MSQLLKSKPFILLLMFIAFAISLMRISDLSRERAQYRAHAVQSIAQSFAGTQAILGPIVILPCTETWREQLDKDSGTTMHTRDASRLYFPDTFIIDGLANIESKKLGIYQSQVFHHRSTIKAQWDSIDIKPPVAENPKGNIQCQSPNIFVAVTDPRGIKQVNLLSQGKALTITSGTPSVIYPNGVQAPFKKDQLLGSVLDVEVRLELDGTQKIEVVPVGKSSQMKLSANWPHPSFIGRTLPTSHTVTDSGFEAIWKASALSSTAQQDIQAGRRLCTLPHKRSLESGFDRDPNEIQAVEVAATVSSMTSSSAQTQGCIGTFTVSFIDPIDTYSLNYRASQYGILLVLMMFVCVAFIEKLQQSPVHPIQYLLVGAALSLFFLLLISMSEHIGFTFAYCCASIACIGLLTFYGSSILIHWRKTSLFGLCLIAVFASLYVILSLEQTALLIGSLASFTGLTVIMVLTRKYDWYSFTGNSTAANSKDQTN